MPIARSAPPPDRQPMPPGPEPGSEPGPTALHIGDLAALAQVSPDALRYYERRGLLRPSGRRASGYRQYAGEAVGVVRFIKQAQALGFSLDEVAELLRLRSAVGQPTSALQAREVAVAKLRDIDEKVRRLGALRTALAGLVADCERTCGDGRALPDARACPIIAALNDGAAELPPSRVPAP